MVEAWIRQKPSRRSNHQPRFREARGPFSSSAMYNENEAGLESSEVHSCLCGSTGVEAHISFVTRRTHQCLLLFQGTSYLYWFLQSKVMALRMRKEAQGPRSLLLMFYNLRSYRSVSPLSWCQRNLRSILRSASDSQSFHPWVGIATGQLRICLEQSTCDIRSLGKGVLFCALVSMLRA